MDPSGVVVTNLHVVEGEEAAAVKLSNGEVYDEVTVLAFDVRRDLVLLKIAAFALQSAALGTRSGKARLFVELTQDGLTELRREIAERSVPNQRSWWGYDVIQIHDPDGNELLFPVSE